MVFRNWFIKFAISEMFCIFPAISLPRAFTLEATEKGLRTSFLLFRCFSDFSKSRGMSPLPKTHSLQGKPCFLEVTPGVLGRSVNFNIIQRFLLRRPMFPDYLSVSWDYVVIYNLNLSLLFVTINFAFSLFWVFTLAHASKSPEFLHRFVFR